MKTIIRSLSVCLGFGLILSIACVPALAQNDQCVWALDKSASNALSISGGVTISAPGCGVVVDSTSNSAMSFAGTGSFTAYYFDIAGGYTKSGGVTLSPTPVTGSAMPPAPLSFLVPPTSNSCTYTNVTVSARSATLNPGTYCNGITVSGVAQVPVNPGTYILRGGGLNVSGSSILSGTGVTFFLTQGPGYSYGPLSVSSGTVMTLKAPTCGPLEGILFYQDPGIGTGKAASLISGSTLSTLEGVMYFATTSLTFTGSAAGHQGNYLTLVADTISLTGSATIPVNYGGLCNAGPLAPPVAVSITPTTATLTGGLIEQFTAQVTNANPSKTGVTWSISPAGVGSINASGL